MTTRRVHLYALVSGVSAGGLATLTRWPLPAALPARVAVGVLVAAQAYAVVALAGASVARVRFRRAGTGARPARRLAVGSVLGLLLLACPPVGAEGYQPVAASAPATLGSEGEAFLRATPDRAAIERITGRPAIIPVRAYVGLGGAATPAARARLAVEELDRAGGFSRSTILAIAPTGSGWVDPAAVRALELLTGGDLATVCVQYADLPSWLEYLTGTGRAERAAAALTAALRARIDAIPPGHRPRLLVFGESLGAIAAGGAVAGADRALLVGRPAGAGWRPSDPRATSLVHADDPVGWWSPALAVRRPTGWPGGWLPVISFWQVSGALPGAVSAPAGHGHHYGAELVDAWHAADPDGPAGAAGPRLLAAARAAVQG